MSSYYLLIFAVAGLALLFLLKKRAQRLPLPPGPRGLPFIGNALSIPAERSWLTYHEWSKIFGDVVYVSALGQSIVVLNSAQAISDLLEHRGAVYSDRVKMVMAGELVGYGDYAVMMPNDARHREFRRLFSEVLNSRWVEELRPLQENKVRNLLKGLLERPDAFREHIPRYIASLVFEISHGHTVKDDDDPYIRLAHQIDSDFSELTVPGAFLVDLFPFLRYIPEWTGVTFKKKARRFRQTLTEATDWPYQQVKSRIAAGNAGPSFTASLIERVRNEEDEWNFKRISGMFYAASLDTSVSSLESFILAMSVHPDKQRKAQAEIDRVVGSERLPTFEDRPQLTYVESVIKEVYRWNPVAPIAVPHKYSGETDDEYRGWRIPKDSIVIGNSWAVMHNAELYPSPFQFYPERYLEQEDVRFNPDPRKFAFGYGRRICPGRLLVDDTLFIAAVTVLALFDIGPLTSGDVPQYTPYSMDFRSHPEAFECSITPRPHIAARDLAYS
ncbi:hypothetical protein GYMLUDRAFT_232002 [Collybiopsis luxurians FD-317 M1]|uniref:Cytochrome P450 n=1 Tax=Collybiopsis luxurians FD-317 M1 TaxID=944289 RepID=A0A0D0AVN8_9AGAR|nr:hypothetical protein GYMLUDRAFT_232002 [Collybiopsis luxurians FD-317 M1]